ncbi:MULTISPECIES: DnaA regulatory inactivator Hda [unclassified Neptuniibacter]|jgi:DnaA family protein|uniref:DnaA regulatory inactivator Hda n=1 Tax=unclassified Neptuniibacter TaxID=2630693 RepID=UPI0026E3C55D|nr:MULTISPECIES: DnaA regulatory inactivator Hda [unclassified Neptuniibacter]MDO6513467.1 DnaA regulatory inactivator Hda [Neptuniibacter sp. 2_MG-2023]MDO6593996.1 DnaA regulatory inactivator Hda [Neptuniibacter sp. 1_MG-2023]
MTTNHPFQIPLSVGLRDDARFENFYSQGNELICASLKAAAHAEGEQFIYIWGGEGVGCTHLLQAVCHEADPAGTTAAYLPLDELKHMGGGILDGMEYLDLVCLDSIDVVVGDKQWEEALFHFFNRIREQGNILIIAASSAPRYLGINLPDLASRLSWGVVFQVQALDDVTKLKAIQMRATARGLEFSEDVARYLLHRASRNMNDLTSLLDTLDQASLSAKRKVTIPFIKEVTGL